MCEWGVLIFDFKCISYLNFFLHSFILPTSTFCTLLLSTSLASLLTHTTPYPKTSFSPNSINSNAKPKIADYAFTTVVPNLGVCDIDGKIDDMGKSLVLVDIPGLLEGAHDGVGLGLSFLRHVQRCR